MTDRQVTNFYFCPKCDKDVGPVKGVPAFWYDFGPKSIDRYPNVCPNCGEEVEVRSGD